MKNHTWLRYRYYNVFLNRTWMSFIRVFVVALLLRSWSCGSLYSNFVNYVLGIFLMSDRCWQLFSEFLIESDKWGLSCVHFSPTQYWFIPIDSAKKIKLSCSRDVQSPIFTYLDTLQKKEVFEINFFVQQNTSKFATLIEKENPRSFFCFSFLATFSFTLWMST